MCEKQGCSGKESLIEPLQDLHLECFDLMKEDVCYEFDKGTFAYAFLRARGYTKEMATELVWNHLFGLDDKRRFISESGELRA